MGKLTLITGGVRSGKSKFAQELANKQSDRVLFVATAEELDKEMELRIKEHRKNRPAHWQTLEATFRIGERIRESQAGPEVIIVD